ncbi:hypothetical protein GQ44DRAFT_741984 [Phaeosphaeriaceae sp. PMI808]|nr:hypothetical protein GQ44DRAFT_741984 [Phaeosphaeriaceae sp. PMI808]
MPPKPQPQPQSQPPSHSHSHSHSQSESHSHSRHSSKGSISDYSPYIHRRLLDTRTEQELRAACHLILQNFKPSDHGMEDTDPRLDFGGLQRGRDQKTKHRNAHRPEPKVRLPTGAPVDLKTALEARGLKQTELTLGRQSIDAPTRANSSRKRADFAWLDDRDEKRAANLRKSSSMRRKSKSFDPAAVADAQATEWMHQERDKLQTDGADGHVRPPSRAQSIKNNIKEYVFSGTVSRSLSRAPSQGSLRTLNTNISHDSSADQPPNSASSQSGWRAWTLPRKSSTRSNSRPGTSKGQLDESDLPKKANPNVVNLNRELPPLPSLDSWKDEKAAPLQQDPIRSPTSANHIASVMRPRDRPSAPNRSHRRSGSDTLALQYAASLQPKPTRTPDSTLSTNPTLVASASTTALTHARHRSTDTSSTPKKSCETVNFSSKMSADVPRSSFSTEVKLSRKEEQKSRLKKVFTGWMHRKAGKEDWMQRVEKEGVKDGVLVQGSVNGVPVVRY